MKMGNRVEIKKGGMNSTFFCPKSTMNLTYLCYGNTKVYRNILGTKNIRRSTFLLVKG